MGTNTTLAIIGVAVALGGGLIVALVYDWELRQMRRKAVGRWLYGRRKAFGIALGLLGVLVVLKYGPELEVPKEVPKGGYKVDRQELVTESRRT
jgi:hypothetical protein